MEHTQSHSCKCLKTSGKCPHLGEIPMVVCGVSFKMVLARTISAYLMYRFMNSKRAIPIWNSTCLNFHAEVP